MNRRSFITSLSGAVAVSALLATPLKAQDEQPRKSSIIRSKCVGCGDCIRACPVTAISFDHGKASVDREKCVACRICVWTCSYGAPK